jgi:integrase
MNNFLSLFRTNKKSVMASIYLTLSNKVEKFSKVQEILIRFSHGKINQRAKTNIFIPSDSWNNEAQEIIIPNKRVQSKENKEQKQYLTNQSEKLNTLSSVVIGAFNRIDKNNVGPDWLKVTVDKFNFPDKYNVVKNTTFFQFIDKFIKESPDKKEKKTGRELSKSTLYQYDGTYKHLIAFCKRDITFSDINQIFYDNFVAYLQNLGFTQNSVGKHIKVLKVILNEATKQGYNTNSYYTTFHVFTEEIDNIYLNEAELQLLKDVDLSGSPHLDHVRDSFLLLSWTGSRFSDLKKISKSDIKDNIISFRQQKTNTKVVIPLHPVVREILEKYDYNLPSDINNKKFNAYIKDGCKIAGIKGTETITRTIGGKLHSETLNKWQLVSSHTGRRSFCTNMYKRGIQTLSIMSISGHKSEKSFLKYIKVTSDEHAEMMLKAWNKIYK